MKKVEDMYIGYHKVTLLDLKELLKVRACLGCTQIDPMSKFWALLEMEWDIDHLLWDVEMLDYNYSA